MAALPSLPAVGPVTLLRALLKGAQAGEGAAGCATAFLLERIDTRHLSRYNAALGFGSDALSITFYYLLVQRAHLATMLRPAFPFRVAGMVHAENDLVELRAADLAGPLELRTEVELEAPTAHGARYCVLRTVGLQQGAAVFECRSRYLAVRGARGAGSRPATASPADDQPRWSPVGEWALTASSGRAYAAVSGDWNPIHLWRWSARLLGMQAPIIHGMHSVGRACALLERLSGRRVRSISAQFKSPLPLGSAVALQADSARGEYRVACKGQTMLTGTFQY